MNKYFYLITLLFVSIFFQKSEAVIVKDILIKNNNRISAETIMTYGDIEIGTDYSTEDLNNKLKNLYETNFFEDISLKIENNILIIDVIENKLVQTIIIEGVKSEGIKEAILDNLTLKDKAPFIESEVSKDILRIKNALNAQGYYFADVNSSIVENLNNTLNLIYDIDMGDKSLVSRIVFTGNKIIKDRTLRNLITTEESRFWKFLSKNQYLKRQSLTRDQRLLKQYYLDEGYYDVIVNTSTASVLNDNTFQITFNIDAGPLYTVNNTKLVLPIDYNVENFKDVNKLLNDLNSQVYSFSKLSKVVDSIDRISLSREYDFITAEINEEKIGNNKIDIIFTVNETEKLYVETINILGNNITQENVIRGSLEVDEGDPFNELLHAKSLNKLRSLNIFKSVKSEIIEGSTPNTKVININIIEKPTGEIALGAGVGSDGAAVSFSVSENNFLGKGVKLSTALNIGGDSISGNFSVNNPNFRYSGRALNTSIQTSNTDKLKTSGYETKKTGFSVGTSFEQYDNFYISPTFSAFHEEITTNSSASKALRAQGGSALENNINYTLDYDLRDRGYQTRNGIRSKFTQGIPLVSEDYALLNGYEITKWHQFENKMISKISFYGRAITALSDGKDVKVSKRLRISPRRLRGFENGKVGPVDGKDYVGGNYASTLNLSTTLPMLFPSFESVDFKYFLDLGNVWGVDYSSTVGESNILRSSTGLNVDWFTPVGPLNFSLSQSLSQASTDKTEKFQFNLGTTF